MGCMYLLQALCLDFFLPRMHHSIMAWPSHSLYDGQLEAHSSVAEHLLK